MYTGILKFEMDIPNNFHKPGNFIHNTLIGMHVYCNLCILAVDALPPLDGRIGPQEVVFDQRSMVTTTGLRLESDHLAVSLIRHIFLFNQHFRRFLKTKSICSNFNVIDDR